MSTKSKTVGTKVGLPVVARTMRARRAQSKISKRELAQLGGGKIAYIKQLSSDEAIHFYPDIEKLPKGLQLYALHGADGTPIALTDDRGTAIAHAMGDHLEIATVH